MLDDEPTTDDGTRRRGTAPRRVPSSDASGSARQIEPSDETLMPRVAARDAAAYRTLVERHLRTIVAFAGRVLGDPVEAEDVAQEVFLRVWSHASTWRAGSARLTTWLHRVALNLCLDRLARRRERPLPDEAEIVDPAPGAATALEQQEIARHVAAAFEHLTDQQRVAITLCHYQGLRNTEAAEVMEISVQALESLLARGRRTLRQRLRKIAPELLGP